MKVKRAISTIFGAVIFLQILALSLLLVIYFVNNESNSTVRAVQNLQSLAEQPMIYEAWQNGEIVLKSDQPFVITHVILPNGDVENVTMFVQNEIPLEAILNGFPWAIIVTSKGTWYNVTMAKIPVIGYDIPDSSFFYGEPWDSAALKVVDDPSYYGNGVWYALQGIKELNWTQTPIPTQDVNGILYTDGITNMEAVYYLNRSIQWVNITFYAPLHYLSYVENAYWEYYSAGYNPGDPLEIATTLNPPSNPWFYVLLTTNPYVDYVPSLYYSAVYYTSQNNITDPQGGTYFHYDYLNASIGVYIPTNDSNGNIAYTYIPFNVFEITNLSALVPQSVSRGYSSSPGHAGHYQANQYNAKWQECQWSWVVAPIEFSPRTPEITQAYTQNPNWYPLYGYIYQGDTYSTTTYAYILPYEAFPATNYNYFPAFIGTWFEQGIGEYVHTNLGGFLLFWQTLPSYPYMVGDKGTAPGPAYYYPIFANVQPTLDVYDWGIYNIFPSNLYTSSNISSVQEYPYHCLPMTVFQLDINLQKDIVLAYGYNPYTFTWDLVFKGIVNPQPLSTNPPTGKTFTEMWNLPVYIAIPQGTYLLAINNMNVNNAGG